MYKLLILLLVFASPAFAIEPLASGELIRRCSDPKNSVAEADLASCKVWLHGFVGGAFATYRASLSEPQKAQTLTDRAKSTRLNPARLHYGRNRLAGHCIPEDKTLEQIVADFNSYVSALDPVPEQANQLMLGFFRAQYPCGKA